MKLSKIKRDENKETKWDKKWEVSRWGEMMRQEDMVRREETRWEKWRDEETRKETRWDETGQDERVKNEIIWNEMSQNKKKSIIMMQVKRRDKMRKLKTWGDS